MGRRITLAVVTLLGGGYAVAGAIGVIDPFDPSSIGPALEQQPQWVTSTIGTILALLLVVGSLWLVVKLLRGYVTLHSRLVGNSGSSFLVFSVASGCIVVLIFAAALFAMGTTTSMWESDSGVTGIAGELDEAGLDPSVLNGDATTTLRSGSQRRRCSQSTGRDSDGDRIPDRWERRGSTPGGAPLPGADPNRKDIYIQPIYGQGAERFTNAEKQQLRAVWDEMDVSNPSGEDGIALHFVDRVPNNGRVDGPVSINDDLDPVRNQYYNEQTLGSGVCTYHLVAIGTVRDESAAGYGESPGYVSIVESTRYPEYGGSVSFRNMVTTHELLHNLVGRIDGDPHPGSGWLGGEKERLASETRVVLENGFRPR